MEKIKMSLLDSEIGAERAGEQPFIINTGYLDDLQKKSARLTDMLVKMQEIQKEKDYDKFYEYSRKAAAASETLTQMIRSVPIRYGNSNAHRDLKHDLSVDTSLLQFDIEDGNVLKIRLKGLLPRRLKNGKIYENLDYIRSSYVEAFRNYFGERRLEYAERVVILIKNCFSSASALIDDDNFDPKIITDMIAQYVLVDDNPTRCMKVYDYQVIGEESSHTEITVFPMNKWAKYIEMPFC